MKMRAGKLILPALGLLLLVSAANSAPPAYGACAPADEFSNSLVEYIGASMVAEADPWRLAVELPRVDPAQVQLVTADSVCVRAREALDEDIWATDPDAADLGPRAIYVIAVGDHFAVHDPHDTSDLGDLAIVILSPTWQVLAVTGF